MKLFFADDLESMIGELRSQDARTVRLHVLHSWDGDALSLRGHVTCFCNVQIYESVVEEHVDGANVPVQERGSFAVQQCRQFWDRLAKKLDRFELKRGILQQ